MKIALFGISGCPLGKYNLKDPRLREAHRLVEAKRKSYAQVDVVGDEETLTADVILTHRDWFADLLLHDLEFVENRLGRSPAQAERAALEKIKVELENERTMYKSGLSKQELQAVAAHNFHTHKPVVVADHADLENRDGLILRTFAEGGFICFLTVGGKENRAWPIRAGLTAVEAAGTIHSDMQRGFIRAEIISFADFLAAGGETQAKRAGRQRLETRNYVMQDYDVVSFRFSK
jgi:ribosome-binding ATPase YchF (GTP1/OBG family)